MTISIGLVTIAAWIALAAVGVIVTAFNLEDALIDYRTLKAAGLSNGRALVAKVALVNEATRITAHILLLIAGILVATRQFKADPPPTSLYVRSVILLVIVMLVSQTVTLRWLRHKIR